VHVGELHVAARAAHTECSEHTKLTSTSLLSAAASTAMSSDAAAVAPLALSSLPDAAPAAAMRALQSRTEGLPALFIVERQARAQPGGICEPFLSNEHIFDVGGRGRALHPDSRVKRPGPRA
jgi:hypothetical protein